MLGFRRYLLFEIFGFFVGGSYEVGSNWVSDCSWKLSKLLLPPLEGASTVKGVPLISNASASTGAGACNGVGEKWLQTRFSFRGEHQHPLFERGTFSRTRCRRFLPPTLTTTAAAGDDAPDACDMVEELTNVAMRNIRVRDRRFIGDHTKPTPR